MEKILHINRFLTLISDNFKLLSITTIIILIYYYYTKNFDYFKKRNVKYIKPVIFFGSNVLGFFALKSQAVVMKNYYDIFKDHAFGGFFEGRSPRYFLCDPELIKTISVSDGDHFIDRRSVESNEAGYSSRSLLLLKGGEWKAVRSLITPTFSSARLKNMFPLIQTCCNQLVDLIARYDKNDIELKAFTGHLTLEVTGVCAFGISTDILKDENAEYYKLAAGNTYMSMPKRIFLYSMLFLMPSVLKYIPISVMDDETNRKLVKIIQNSKAERRSGSSKRSDLLQLLVDASLQEKEELLKSGRQNKIYLDDDTIDAQALLFLQAGFGTTCILLTYALFTLALHTDIQDKLRTHILEVTKGKEISYEQLVELEYLESILNETLRMYPPVPRIDRCCSKPYTIPGTSVHLKVGDIVVIPVYGLHMDPQLYPEPEIFKPDRFMKNGKLDRLPDSFLAFGSGPRYCIGRRFSMIVAKAAMVTLLTNFKFTICPKTIYPLGISKTEILFHPEEGAWVRVEKIQV